MDEWIDVEIQSKMHRFRELKESFVEKGTFKNREYLESYKAF